jgi:hypothetical protein
MLSHNQRKEEEVDEHAQNELTLLNRSMIDKAIQITTNHKPTSDLWPQFRQANADYKKRRSEILESQNPKPEISGEYLGNAQEKRSYALQILSLRLRRRDPIATSI